MECVARVQFAIDTFHHRKQVGPLEAHRHQSVGHPAQLHQRAHRQILGEEVSVRQVTALVVSTARVHLAERGPVLVAGKLSQDVERRHAHAVALVLLVYIAPEPLNRRQAQPLSRLLANLADQLFEVAGRLYVHAQRLLHHPSQFLLLLFHTYNLIT